MNLSPQVRAMFIGAIPGFGRATDVEFGEAFKMKSNGVVEHVIAIWIGDVLLGFWFPTLDADDRDVYHNLYLHLHSRLQLLREPIGEFQVRVMVESVHEIVMRAVSHIKTGEWAFSNRSRRCGSGEQIWVRRGWSSNFLLFCGL